MSIAELMLLAVGVSMDAFSVAICKGLSLHKIRVGQVVEVGLWFGVFQAVMPLIGFLVGIGFSNYIVAWDHWIAFVLLGFLGFNMLRNAKKGEDACLAVELDRKEMLALSLATSVDALAVGVTFAFLKVNIMQAVSVIGATTFAFSAVGVWLGRLFGARFRTPAQILGGVVLMLIGLKILLEHLDIFG